MNISRTRLTWCMWVIRSVSRTDAKIVVKDFAGARREETGRISVKHKMLFYPNFDQAGVGAVLRLPSVLEEEMTTELKALSEDSSFWRKHENGKTRV